MAKVRKGAVLLIDQTLLIGILCAATSYVVRGTWSATFFEAAALLIGGIWSYRVIMTSREKTFRLLAALMFVLIWALLSLYLGAAHQTF